MVSAIGQLLPIMLAVAVSTVPILVTVTVLLAPRSLPSSLAFLIGMVIGLFTVTGALTLILQSSPAASARTNNTAIGVVEIVIGCGLVAYGVILLVRSHGASAQTELPSWLRAVGTLSPIAMLGLAFALNFRPKAILLSAAAAVILGTSRLTVTETLVVLAVFVTVGVSTVAAPVLLTMANPLMMRQPLEATRQWIIRNNRTATSIVVLVVGTVVLGDGMTRL